MRPRIAIPVPHSLKPEYVQRSLPQYEAAIEQAGGEPVRIGLELAPDEVARLISQCDAVLLPGSPADIDPQKYEQPKGPHTAAPDPKRDMVDELLLQDAYNMRTPVFGICYGLQSLNVWRTGTLRQHVAGTGVEHEAGRDVLQAHAIRIEPGSRLAAVLGTARGREIDVNSSHHQAADVVGDGLRVGARSAADDVIEAIEGTAPEHFVLAVQWHPERTVETDEASRALFRALVEAAREWRARMQAA